jgi:hypothetical protein
MLDARRQRGSPGRTCSWLIVSCSSLSPSNAAPAGTTAASGASAVSSSARPSADEGGRSLCTSLPLAPPLGFARPFRPPAPSASSVGPRAPTESPPASAVAPAAPACMGDTACTGLGGRAAVSATADGLAGTGPPRAICSSRSVQRCCRAPISFCPSSSFCTRDAFACCVSSSFTCSASVCTRRWSRCACSRSRSACDALSTCARRAGAHSSDEQRTRAL